ncbi:hypothetical protein PYW07_009966 [Mythimna separata]|uniref:Uncharacterized protein n=1 Tax=Mythimna separata TaxID=271217 RepID=A0AAD7YH97_MYTSE|nr:hypothetical protein PYW07_009957 [Mythimna separata]KAJ8715477.1 hypothetical protein PYW07_009959 [Mythimna separata]KAJ8715478.1 hypothetical protein PYW07_009960 [Mythimna separata]KAJ8715479.1 hypothetical protein PYW07_009961 [Mythimna separata]KAJ8715480.1 hypothetical protein PYW07_009962 [Mythimna separata]
MYGVYCVALRFNTALERWAMTLPLPFKLPTREEQAALVTYRWIMYGVYCVALRFNTALERWAMTLPLPFKLPTREEQAALVTYRWVLR